MCYVVGTSAATQSGCLAALAGGAITGKPATSLQPLAVLGKLAAAAGGRGK
jgi:hypothetical protein